MCVLGPNPSPGHPADHVPLRTPNPHSDGTPCWSSAPLLQCASCTLCTGHAGTPDVDDPHSLHSHLAGLPPNHPSARHWSGRLGEFVLSNADTADVASSGAVLHLWKATHSSSSGAGDESLAWQQDAAAQGGNTHTLDTSAGEADEVAVRYFTAEGGSRRCCKQLSDGCCVQGFCTTLNKCACTPNAHRDGRCVLCCQKLHATVTMCVHKQRSRCTSHRPACMPACLPAWLPG